MSNILSFRALSTISRVPTYTDWLRLSYYGQIYAVVAYFRSYKPKNGQKRSRFLVAFEDRNYIWSSILRSRPVSIELRVPKYPKECKLSESGQIFAVGCLV